MEREGEREGGKRERGGKVKREGERKGGKEERRDGRRRGGEERQTSSELMHTSHTSHVQC